MITCPLCTTVFSHPPLETVATADLDNLYRKTFGISTDYEEETLTLDYIACPTCTLHFFHPLLPGGKPFYTSLCALPFYYSEEKEEFRVAREHIRSGDKVLEVGAGSGAFSAHLPPNCEYTGLDFNPTAETLALEHGRLVRAESLDVHAQEHQAQYDVVCAFQTLEHVANPHDFLHDLGICLRPEGLLLLSVPNENSFLCLDTNAVLHLPPHHLTHWTHTALSHAAQEAGCASVHLQEMKTAQEHLSWHVTSLALEALRQARGIPRRVVDLSANFLELKREAAKAALSLHIDENAPGHTVLLTARRAMI